jgi:hypothetical protein
MEDGQDESEKRMIKRQRYYPHLGFYGLTFLLQRRIRPWESRYISG